MFPNLLFLFDGFVSLIMKPNMPGRAKKLSLRVLVGRRVREARRERGLSQEGLADRSNLSVNMVGYIERGIRAPSLETIERLGTALDVEPASLLQFHPRDVVEESRARALKEIEGILREAPPDYIRIVSRFLKDLKKGP